MQVRFIYYGRKLFLLALIAFCVCFSTVSRADFVVEGVLTVGAVGKASTLKYKIASADVNDPTPNPCYQKGCLMAVTWFHSGGSSFSQRYGPGGFVSDSKTLGEIGAALYRMGDVGKEMRSDVYGTSLSCIYFGYKMDGISGGFLRFPGQSCHQVSVDPAQCYFETGSANINYGVVRADRVNGQIAQTVIHASCTQDIRVKVISAQASGSMVNLRPDGRLKAKITINDAPMSNGYTFTATPAGTALNIKSELIASGEILPGDFNGSAVIVITLA